MPATFGHIESALRDIGSSVSQVRAILLTHAHFDHVGSARHAHRQWQAPVWTHRQEAYLAAHPYRYKHERNRLLYSLRYPQCIRVLVPMATAGALMVRGVPDTTLFDTARPARRTGPAQVVFTPGHPERTGTIENSRARREFSPRSGIPCQELPHLRSTTTQTLLDGRVTQG